MNKLLIIPTLAIPLLLGGCVDGIIKNIAAGYIPPQAGGPNPLPNPNPLPTPPTRTVFNSNQAVAIAQNGAVSATTVSVTVPADRSSLTVTTGGQTFVLPRVGGAITTAGVTAYQFGATNGAAGDTGTLITGNYVGVAAVAKNVNPNAGTFDNAAISVGGSTTAANSVPLTVATYNGQWTVMIPTATLVGNGGTFTATVNLTAGNNSVAINGIGGNGATVTGTGTVNQAASSFTSSFDIAGGAVPGTNTVTGNFYGPAAEEIGGTVSGTSGGNATTGFVLGAR